MLSFGLPCNLLIYVKAAKQGRMKNKTCSFLLLSCSLKLCIAGGAGEGEYIAYVLDAGQIHDEALKAETEP